MANKSGGRKRLERWTTNVRRWNGDFEVRQSAIEALSKAEKQFGFDLRKEQDRLHLLYILADIVFGGKRGRPRDSKKWDYFRLLRLAEDRIEVEREIAKLSDSKAATEIKKRYPDRYKDTSAEMVRQMLREASLAHWWQGEEASQAAMDHAREEWESRGDSDEGNWNEDL